MGFYRQANNLNDLKSPVRDHQGDEDKLEQSEPELPLPLHFEKALAIARMPKRLYDESITSEQIVMCGLGPSFETFQTDMLTAPARAQPSLSLGLTPLRYDCKIAFLMVRMRFGQQKHAKPAGDSMDGT